MNSDFALILHDLKSLRVQLEQNVSRLEKWRCSRELPAAPVSCVPVHEDVQSCTWGTFMLLENLDIVMMDPPWSLAGAHPTRGVALGYSQMSDASVLQIPVHILQSTGILMVWAINAKYQRCLDMIGHWGYEVVDELVWVKTTKHRRLAKSHGYYLQHAKEVCLIARRESVLPSFPMDTQDLLLSSRRGQSQKPQEIYFVAESLASSGTYVEVFGRRNNLRRFWITIGNEVMGSCSASALRLTDSK